MGEEGGALAHEVGAAAEQVARFAHALGVDVGEGEVAAAQQAGDLAGVDAVVLGLAAVDGLHVEGVADEEGDVCSAAEVGEPVPGEHALDADDDVAEGGEGSEKASGRQGRLTSATTVPVASRTQRCMVLACRSMPA